MLSIISGLISAAIAVVITLRWSVVAARKEPPAVAPDVREALSTATQLQLFGNLEARMSALEADHKDVRAAVAHGIEDIERVDNRIKATVRRVKTQLAEADLESPAIDAEAEQLRLIDGGGGDRVELPPVHEGVEELQSSIPGVSAAELAKVRGTYHGG